MNEAMEGTFTIEDADLDKLYDVVKEINVMDCPWFEVQDKHGNKAKYYREPQWIPCSERLPEVWDYVLCSQINGDVGEGKLLDDGYWHICYDQSHRKKSWVKAWQPLPEKFKEEGGEE